jgi:hypothetical protein
VTFEGEGFLAGIGIPHLEGVVQAAANDALAIWAERHANDRLGVTFEGEGLLAGVGQAAAVGSWA